MLIEFSVENYRSIRDKQTLSMVASNYETELHDNYHETKNLNLLKSVALYGANASGKSNLIKAFGAMINIIGNTSGDSSKLDKQIVPFLLNNEGREKPTTFELIFLIDGILHQYGFSATKSKIVNEWLYVSPKGREQVWFLRGFPEIEKTDENGWYLGPSLMGGIENEKLKGRTKQHVLYLTACAEWNHKQLEKIHHFLVVNFRTIRSPRFYYDATARMFHDDKEGKHYKGYSKLIEDYIIFSDFGISEVNIQEMKGDEISFPDMYSTEYKKELRSQYADSPPLKTVFLHKDKKTNEIFQLELADVSEGTQEFYFLLGPWIDTILSGYTLFIDELESSLHPLLVRALIESIHAKGANKSAQIVFSTHDTTVLDPELLRRDQIWFTEKDESGATALIPLSDYKPRPGEALEKGYLSGRYGAIPILEKFDLNVSKT